MKKITKKDLIKLLENKKLSVTELKSDEVYLVKIELGDMPAQEVEIIINRVKELFEKAGIKNCIFVPTHKGLGDFTFIKLGKTSEVELA